MPYFPTMQQMDFEGRVGFVGVTDAAKVGRDGNISLVSMPSSVSQRLDLDKGKAELQLPWSCAVHYTHEYT